MDIKKIKELSDFMKKENLQTLEIEEKDFRVMLVKHDNVVKPVPSGFSAVAEKPIGLAPKKGHEVKSPLVGVFYSAPAPDAKPYVEVGKRVKKGDILCVVEAMKQMNEIVADIDGEIAEIVPKNGDIVEFDVTLFRII